MKLERKMNNVGSLIVLLVEFKESENEKGVTNPMTMYSHFVKYYIENDEVFGDFPMMLVFGKALDVFTKYGEVELV
jgi:hypothetical protein